MTFQRGKIWPVLSSSLTHCKLVVILGTKTFGKRTGSDFGTLEELRYFLIEVILKKPFFLVKMCDTFEDLEEAETFFRLPSSISYYFPWQPTTEAERGRLPNSLVDT